MEEHLKVDQLATWTSPPYAGQVKYAHDLSTGCDQCWSALASVDPVEPRRLKDPFLRTIARGCHPKVELSLPAQAIRPLMHPKFHQRSAWGGFRPDDFPMLLLQESIALGLETECPEPGGFGFLDLPLALAKFLRKSSKTREAGRDLQVNVACAAVDDPFSHTVEMAEEALESARRHFSEKCLPSTEVNLLLAETKLACMKARDSRKYETAFMLAADLHSKLSLIQDDPVRRFEISCEVARTLNELARTLEIIGPSELTEAALSELELGSLANEVHRLNGLFHKARFATVEGSRIPDLPNIVAAELESSVEPVYQYGGYFSLARYQELLGILRDDTASIERALYTYEVLGLDVEFLEAWKALDKLDRESRSRISARAYKAFSQEASHRMIREIISGTEQVTRTEVLA